jgi:hypothetical protein
LSESQAKREYVLYNNCTYYIINEDEGYVIVSDKNGVDKSNIVLWKATHGRFPEKLADVDNDISKSLILRTKKDIEKKNRSNSYQQRSISSSILGIWKQSIVTHVARSMFIGEA